MITLKPNLAFSPLILVGLLSLPPAAMGASSPGPVLPPGPEQALSKDCLLLRPPEPPAPLLKRGDRLAICGDSITEQRMYSRMIEDYLVMCVPQMQIQVRQYGWSGEKADGFLRRMTNDVLRFKPTLATTCYGMNDHLYRPYEQAIGMTYKANSRAIVQAFKGQGVRVVQGSPGIVGRMPDWVKQASGTVVDLNYSLGNLRNIGVDLAVEERVGFADVYHPMLKAAYEAGLRYGTNYAVPGKDGVHPDWAGQAIMAYAFLKSFGLPGEIGTFTVDLKRRRLETSPGHTLVQKWDLEFQIRSTRYPFCVCAPAATNSNYPVCGKDDPSGDSSIRSAFALVPFHQELNRFLLVARNAGLGQYAVRWGASRRIFSGDQLTAGINLAVEFPENPFCAAFGRVDAAVAARQAFETRQIKEIFHGPEGKADMEAAVSRTEVERAVLDQAVRTAFAPVDHMLSITPLAAR